MAGYWNRQRVDAGPLIIFIEQRMKEWDFEHRIRPVPIIPWFMQEFGMHYRVWLRLRDERTITLPALDKVCTHMGLHMEMFLNREDEYV